ncbi:hypothetical protein BURPS1710A_A0774 [Burkholderia pseudomallei 1710a]|uniref:Uncharacterized protein n=1 Tax=Burkholderia pseudomallei 1710a TaxID=320371 RepID=A0A0E1W2D9_BURPE|nr:hypothetical protein BURPS1710A_A0774 [Burkholderia pseudomallei 1710a]
MQRMLIPLTTNARWSSRLVQCKRYSEQSAKLQRAMHLYLFSANMGRGKS